MSAYQSGEEYDASGPLDTRERSFTGNPPVSSTGNTSPTQVRPFFFRASHVAAGYPFAPDQYVVLRYVMFQALATLRGACCAGVFSDRRDGTAGYAAEGAQEPAGRA